MIHAYDKVYLDKARTALGRMLDFAVYDLHFDIDDFFRMFISSGIASRFEQGDFTLLVGKSGIELAYEVLELSNFPIKRVRPHFSYDRSHEYWLGWVLAYYQWQTSMSFSDITESVPLQDILKLYSPYHEMDIRQFCDKLTKLYNEAHPESNLKRIRQNAGISQRTLAELSGIPVRTIQQYEQRQKNINKAQVEYLISLSRALYCNIEDLIEKI